MGAEARPVPIIIKSKRKLYYHFQILITGLKPALYLQACLVNYQLTIIIS